MKSPFTGKEMSIQKEWRKMIFRKEEFDVLFHTYKCNDTGEQFEDEAFAELNYNQLLNQYRAKYAIPYPEEITHIREKYGLSAKRMSEILGFGINTYRQYEAGEIPSTSNARLIQMASDPDKFLGLVKLCESIDSNAKEKLLKKVETLSKEIEDKSFSFELIDYFIGNNLADRFTGFRRPDFEKMKEMIVFFSHQLKPWKTALNKLLFYADFTMFKQFGRSISGTTYYAIDKGPVPNNFNSIYEYLVNENVIDVDYITFPAGYTGEKFKPSTQREFWPSIFTDLELEVLYSVVHRFKGVSAGGIVEISHQEAAWLENIDNKKAIDYIYAFDLK